MRVKLDFNDGTTLYPSKPTKRKIAFLLRGKEGRNEAFEGKGLVTYGKGYKNEFEFTDRKDLEHKLWPCLEPELVKEFE